MIFRRATRSGRFLGTRPTSSSVLDSNGRKRSRTREFGLQLRSPQQDGELVPLAIGDADLCELAHGAAEVLADQHVALAGKRPLHAPPSQREGPFHHVHRVDFPLMIDADLLQVVQQPGLRSPDSARGLTRQGQEKFLPRVRVGLLDLQGRQQAMHQAAHVGLQARFGPGRPVPAARPARRGPDRSPNGPRSPPLRPGRPGEPSDGICPLRADLRRRASPRLPPPLLPATSSTSSGREAVLRLRGPFRRAARKRLFASTSRARIASIASGSSIDGK